MDDYEVIFPNAYSLFFTKYTYISSTEETEFYLIGNRGIEGGLLIPEAKTTDYFMLIRGFIDDEDYSALIIALNDIEGVITATEIDIEKLKSKENLVF